MEIKLEQNEHKGRVVVEVGGRPKGAMTFNLVGLSLLIIDHTEVDQTLQGQGIGRAMLDKIVTMARTEGKKILPLCPFAKAEFMRDSMIADVWKKSKK